MPVIAQLVEAKPGYAAVIANLKTGKPEFHPIIMWGLIEEQDEECEECEEKGEDCEVSVSQGVVGMILEPDRRGYTLQPSYLCDGCIGIAAPDDQKELWESRVNEYLAMKAAGMLDEPQETPQKWN